MAKALTDSEKAFLAFKWEESEQWQHYYNNLFPAPPASKLPKYKRAWYRRAVDPNFPADSTVGDVDTPSTSKSTSTPTARPAQETPRRSFLTFEMVKDVLVRLELAARLIFLASTFLMIALRLTRILPVRHFMLTSTASTMSYFLFLIFAILKDHGKPKVSLEYLTSVIGDGNLIYIAFGAAVFHAPKALVILAPQVLTCLIGLDKLYKNHHHLMPLLLKSDVAVAMFKMVDNYIVEMHTLRAVMEVAVLFHMIFGLIFGGWTIISVLLFSNFIKMKLARNDVYLVSVFRQVHDAISRLVAHPSLPPVVRNGYHKVVVLLQKYFMPRRP